MHFLEKFFPKEVKAKQKENERALARDMYGEDYDKKCVVMWERAVEEDLRTS